jgi:radical SAM protein with 4Fe4S-binding SPASM domain
MYSFSPRSFHLQWHITERCNLSCKHCYFDQKFIKEELSKESLFKIFDKYIKQIKFWKLNKEKSRITFIGGEPFIREDFYELLQKAYDNSRVTDYGIATNGTLINKNSAIILKDLMVNYVQVSLEGRKAVNDSIRGKGSFIKAIRSLKILKKAGLNISISFTASKMNIEEIPYLIKIALNLGIKNLSVRRLVPIGRGKDIRKMLLTPEEIKRLYLYSAYANQKTGLKMDLGCESGILAQIPFFFPNRCSAGYLSFSILPNGDIFPCRRLPLYAGNLLKESFNNIYYDSKIFKQLRNINNINSSCKNCPYFSECGGGAKCINYGYFQNPFSPDPQCWRLFKNLPPALFKIEKEKKENKLDERWIIKNK